MAVVYPGAKLVREFAQGPAKIVCASPTYKYIAAEAHWSQMQIARQGYDFIESPSMSTERTRNHFVEYLLDHPEYTHILMMDDDQVVGYDVPARMIARWYEDRTRLVIAGLNFNRTFPHKPLVMVEDAEGNLREIDKWPRATIFPVVLVAASVMLIHRSVFPGLKKPYFLAPATEGQAEIGTEDYGFCRKCKEAGIKVYLDSGIKPKHIGVLLVDEHVYRMANPDVTPGPEVMVPVGG